MPSSLVKTSCYYCGGSSSRPFAAENGFALVQCSGCGLLYVFPRPQEQDIAEAVRQGLHPGNLETTARFYPPHLWEYRRVLRDLYGSACNYSGLMPASFTTAPHFFSSVFM